eukprot:gene702-biopygen443
MVDKMTTCFLQTHARLRASERDCKRALLEKIVWRHCLFPRSSELLEAFREKDTPLLDAIVKVYVEEAPAPLEVFEDWCSDNTDTVSAIRGVMMDVRNYASRTREVIKTLNLGVLDPADLVMRYASAPLDPAKPNAVPLHNFVLRYVHNRNLLKPVARHPEDHHKPIIGSLVVVDNRPNVWSMLSVLVTLDNLDVRRWPRVVVFCAPENERFVQRSLPPSLLPGGVELVTVVMESLSYAPPLPGQKPFSIEKYSNILKDASFWRRLKEVAVGDMALFVQDDGMIVRPGIEEDEEIMAQDYVGAPWADAPAKRN